MKLKIKKNRNIVLAYISEHFPLYGKKNNVAHFLTGEGVCNSLSRTDPKILIRIQRNLFSFRLKLYGIYACADSFLFDYKPTEFHLAENKNKIVSTIPFH